MTPDLRSLHESRPVPLKQTKIEDSFWSKYITLIREVVIPYQWKALNDQIPDAEPSHAIQNFRIAAGEEEGNFFGMVFQDSDVAKWLEAVGYSLTTHPDPELEDLADQVIDLIGKAQQEDGYLNTYYTIKEPANRWTNLYECHELYCAGHMMEAAVAYYQATGKKKFLDIMCLFADHIDSVFGPEPEKLKGYPGHQEVELALVKLYLATGEKRYLKLSQYFIDERGKQPSYFLSEWEKRGRTSHWHTGTTPPNLEYNQSHLPVRQQTKAVGHAVRAVYMYTAMADLAAQTKDPSLYEACKNIWKNIVQKQMYITGGIGSTAQGEAFTFDYDLPNDTVYAETCASVGLIFFAHRMLQIEAKSEYADVLERALYNNVIAGMSQDGKQYFYVNPLEVWPSASEKNPNRRHVKAVRQKWFGCSCCPPNIARLIASLGQYIYTSNESTVFTHLYIGGEANLKIGDDPVKIKQETSYPWQGQVKLSILESADQEFTLALRIPGWSQYTRLMVNGAEVELQNQMVDGYAKIKKVWKKGDIIELRFDMEVKLIESNPQVRANSGKVAIQRGPLLYCLEEEDNLQPLSTISIPLHSKLTTEYVLDGIVSIKGEAICDVLDSWQNALYRPVTDETKSICFKAVPYCMWGNRTLGEMQVWVRVNK